MRELRAFAKIDLAPGASEMVSFKLGNRDFAHWSTAHSAWLVPSGRYELAIGSSSRDLRLAATIEIDGTIAGRPPLSGDVTLAEWLDDPRGRATLTRAVGVRSDGRPRGILGDASRIRVVGNFPLRALAIFPGTGLSHDLIDTICAELGEDSGPP